MSPYSQFFGVYPWRKKTSQKIIALTFDDGPNEPYSSQIVDFLNQKGIKATFFQVGECIKRHPEVTKKMIRSGHVIGNHSLSHKFHKYFVDPSFKKEISQNQHLIETYTGLKPALFRSPWLWRQPLLLGSLKQQQLYPISGQFAHPLEVLQIDATKIAHAAIKKAKPGSIIIFHDGYDGRGANRSQTVEAVKIFVEQLSKSGYQFVTVDQLLGIEAYQP